jgi:hypothetical protein
VLVNSWVAKQLMVSKIGLNSMESVTIVFSASVLFKNLSQINSRSNAGNFVYYVMEHLFLYLVLCNQTSVGNICHSDKRLEREVWDVLRNVRRSSCKVSVIFLHLRNQNWETKNTFIKL